MTNGSSSDRLDRIERILEEVAVSSRKVAANLEQFQEEVAVSNRKMAGNLEQFQEKMDKVLSEMAARQQYHNEAFERHDAEMKAIREVQAGNTQNIRALLRIVENHQRRLEDLDGGGGSA